MALPAIGRDLAASAVQLSLIQSAQILAIAMFLLPAGRYAEIHGRKRIFIAGITILGVTTIALALVKTI